MILGATDASKSLPLNSETETSLDFDGILYHNFIAYPYIIISVTLLDVGFWCMLITFAQCLPTLLSKALLSQALELVRLGLALAGGSPWRSKGRSKPKCSVAQPRIPRIILNHLTYLCWLLGYQQYDDISIPYNGLLLVFYTVAASVLPVWSFLCSVFTHQHVLVYRMSCNTHIVPAVCISILMLYYMFSCYESRTFWSTLQKTNTGFLEQVLEFTVNLVTPSGSKGVMAASESQLFSRWMDSAKRWHYNTLLKIAVHSKMCEGCVSKTMFLFASNRLENHLLVNKWTWMKRQCIFRK